MSNRPEKLRFVQRHPEAKILMGLGRWPMEYSACNKKTLHRVIEVDI